MAAVLSAALVSARPAASLVALAPAPLARASVAPGWREPAPAPPRMPPPA
jgi:hypothetical protein